MKAILAATCVLALASISSAEAKGCLKGAASPATWPDTASSALRPAAPSAITRPASRTPITRTPRRRRLRSSAEPGSGRYEDLGAFREPHRRAQRWLTLADLSRRPRFDAELEPRDRNQRRAGRRQSRLACAGRRRRQTAVIPEGESWPVREVKNALKDS